MLAMLIIIKLSTTRIELIFIDFESTILPLY